MSPSLAAPPADLMWWLAVVATKGTTILALSLLLARALRRAPGRARHLLWTWAFAGLLALPLLAVALPILPLPLPSSMTWAAPAERRVEDTRFAFDGENHARGRTNVSAVEVAPILDFEGGLTGTELFEPDAGRARSWLTSPPSLAEVVPTALASLWLAGFVAAVASLAVSLFRGWSLARRATPVDDAAWLRDLRWFRGFLGISRPVRILESRGIRAPMTGGVWRPVVLLPEGAREWPRVRRRVVLRHELVHIRRHDVVRHLLARLGVALYWFNPLAWLAARHSSVAREQACDEEVVRLGTKPSVYAAHLLEFAEALGPRRTWIAALPIIQRSQLEKRMTKILDPGTRPPIAARSVAATILMVVASVSVGMAMPVAQQKMGPQQSPSVGPPSATVSGLEVGVASVFAEPSSAQPSAELAPAPLATAGPIAQDMTCWPDGQGEIRGNFSGTLSVSDRGGVRIVNAVGVRGNGDHIVQMHSDGMRLCMHSSGDVELDEAGTRVERIGNGARIVLEAERSDELQRMELRGSGSGIETTWSINGNVRQVDAEAEQWRDLMMAVLGDYAQISRLRGQRSSLQGRISSIHGHRSSLQGRISAIYGRRSSLQGQISSIQGRRSSMQGRMSSAQGRVSSMQGRISSTQGHVSSLQGRISSHQSAISGLQSARRGASDEELELINQAISRREQEIADIRQEIDDYDVAARIADIRQEIEDFDLDARLAEVDAQLAELDDDAGQIADIQRRIEELDVEGEVAQIEREIDEVDVEGQVAEIGQQIEDLDVDNRVSEIEERLEPRMRELQQLIERIGR